MSTDTFIYVPSIVEYNCFQSIVGKGRKGEERKGRGRERGREIVTFKKKKVDMKVKSET